MLHHVFLSYSRKDSSLMWRVRNTLIAAGISVWTDEGIKPGTPSWDREIEDALRNTGCIIVILTPNVIDAKGLRDEINYANIHKILIIPLLADGDPEESIPYRLSSTQWIDIRQDYSTQMNQLVQTVYDHINTESRLEQFAHEEPEDDENTDNNGFNFLDGLRGRFGSGKYSTSDPFDASHHIGFIESDNEDDNETDESSLTSSPFGRLGTNNSPSFKQSHGQGMRYIGYNTFDDEESDDASNADGSSITGNPFDSLGQSAVSTSSLGGITSGLSGLKGRFGGKSSSSPLASRSTLSNTNRGFSNIASLIMRFRLLIIGLVLIAIIVAMIILNSQPPLK